ncbi:MAG TPA: PLD nuclease N-terminal domain-containing protein [Coriobacteriia bacterium]|nr:PLD nuclease N-terminal domain-containing protein [Coriobacteriia bacterium]
MLEIVARELGVSTGVVAGGIVLLAVQIAVQVWALVDLVRRQRVRFDRKWIWAVVIVVFGNSFVGPIVYAVAGRRVPQEFDDHPEEPVSDADERVRRAIDAVYGDQTRP